MAKEAIEGYVEVLKEQNEEIPSDEGILETIITVQI